MKMKLVVLCVLCGVAAGSLLLWQFVYGNKPLPPAGVVAKPSIVVTKLDTVADVQKFKVSVAELLRESGPEAAYAELKSSFASAAASSQHLAAHLFGATLFETLGVESVRTCDPSFGFGCFHGFFAAAVAAHGLDQVATLDASCVKAYGPLGTGCQHGIGHGIMEYFGPDKLLDALNACAKTTQQSFLFGCTSGVFMEYNVPIVVTDTSALTAPRLLDTSKPLSPCTGIATEGWRLSCFYELAQFWLQGNSFSQMGKWCAQIGQTTEQSVCMYGVGNMVAVHYHYSVADIIHECDTYGLPNIRQACKAGAAWALYAQPDVVRSHAAEVCEQDSECLTRAVLICNFMANSKDKEACLVSNKISTLDSRS
jgi:hypothetical protein